VTDDIDDKPQPLLAHLLELRNRLMWAIGAFFIAFLLCFSFAKPLFNMLVQPFTWAVDWAGMSDRKIELIYTAPQEFFFTQIKIGMFGGLVLAFPMIAAQVYKFVAPGLYKNERGAFLPFLVAFAIVVPARCCAGLFLFTPMVSGFFLSMEQTGGGGEASIMLLPKVSEYLGLNHDADLRLWTGVPASGGDHVVGPRRSRTARGLARANANTPSLRPSLRRPS
jgi:sec-independent protein translocase protein TatC